MLAVIPAVNATGIVSCGGMISVAAEAVPTIAAAALPAASDSLNGSYIWPTTRDVAGRMPPPADSYIAWAFISQASICLISAAVMLPRALIMPAWNPVRCCCTPASNPSGMPNPSNSDLVWCSVSRSSCASSALSRFSRNRASAGSRWISSILSTCCMYAARSTSDMLRSAMSVPTPICDPSVRARAASSGFTARAASSDVLTGVSVASGMLDSTFCWSGFNCSDSDSGAFDSGSRPIGAMPGRAGRGCPMFCDGAMSAIRSSMFGSIIFPSRTA